LYHLGSLFSGAGGLDLGFVLTSHFEAEFAVELLESATETYAENSALPIISPADIVSSRAVFKGNVEDIDFSKMYCHNALPP